MAIYPTPGTRTGQILLELGAQITQIWKYNLIYPTDKNAEIEKRSTGWLIVIQIILAAALIIGPIMLMIEANPSFRPLSPTDVTFFLAGDVALFIVYKSYAQSEDWTRWLFFCAFITVLINAMGTFAFEYYSLSHAGASSFNMVLTKIDAIYFTITTLTTAGFGDIHPVSELSRLYVTAQELVDLVFTVLGFGLLVNSIIIKSSRGR